MLTAVPVPAAKKPEKPAKKKGKEAAKDKTAAMKPLIFRREA